MKQNRSVKVLSPALVLLFVCAMLLLPQAQIAEDTHFQAPLSFGAAIAWADSLDPSNGGPEPQQDPDLPRP